MIAPFERGVRFECTRCGKCCASLSSDIPLSNDDLRRMSSFLGMRVGRFVRRYGKHFLDEVRIDGGVLQVPSVSLRVPRSGRCVFLGADGGCSIQPAKPDMCRNSPFVAWVAFGKPNVWAKARAECPGIGAGRWHSARDIGLMIRAELAAERRDFAELAAAGFRFARLFRSRLPKPRTRRLRLPVVTGAAGSAPSGADTSPPRAANRRREGSR